MFAEGFFARVIQVKKARPDTDFRIEPAWNQISRSLPGGKAKAFPFSGAGHATGYDGPSAVHSAVPAYTRFIRDGRAARVGIPAFVHF